MEENFHELDPKCKINWIVLYCFLSAGISTGASEGVSECCNCVAVKSANSHSKQLRQLLA